MRRIQMSASGAGECAVHSALEEIGDAVVVGGLSVVNATTAGRATIFCWLQPDLANGCAGRAVFFCDVSQQALFAQHPASHAFSLGAFERMHEAAEDCAGATKSAMASTADTPILLNIGYFIARSGPQVESNGQICGLFIGMFDFDGALSAVKCLMRTAAARLLICVQMVCVALFAPVLPVQAEKVSAKKSNHCSEIVAQESRCHGCPSDADTQDSTTRSTCCFAQHCCVVLYLTNAQPFIAQELVLGTINGSDEHASKRAHRPPVPPPRVAPV